MVGNEYQAEVFLSAFSTTTPITLETDSSKPNQSVSYKNGICLFQSISDREGTYEFKGKLKVKGPNGKDVTFPFATEYKTFKPFAVIESSDEFVLHRGKENKINVSMAGIALEDLYILVSNAKVSGENGKYTLIPGKENKCLISVLAHMKDGNKMMNQLELRVVDK